MNLRINAFEKNSQLLKISSITSFGSSTVFTTSIQVISIYCFPHCARSWFRFGASLRTSGARANCWMSRSCRSYRRSCRGRPTLQRSPQPLRNSTRTRTRASSRMSPPILLSTDRSLCVHFLLTCCIVTRIYIRVINIV